MAKQKEKLEREEGRTYEERPKLVAKRDFILHHNDFKREIKVGDDLSDIPEIYHVNLKTEGVL